MSDSWQTFLLKHLTFTTTTSQQVIHAQLQSVVCLSAALSLPLLPLWHTWQQQWGQAVFPTDKYSDTSCLTSWVHQAEIGMDRLWTVCRLECVCVCACVWQPRHLHGVRPEFWIGLRCSLHTEPSRPLHPPTPLPLRDRDSCFHHPLLPASSAHPEEEGWALLSCQPEMLTCTGWHLFTWNNLPPLHYSLLPPSFFYFFPFISFAV